MIKFLIIFTITILFIGVLDSFAAEPITFDLDTDILIPGEIVEVSGSVDPNLADKPVAIEIRDSEGHTILIRSIQPNPDGTFSLKFKVPSTAPAGEFEITAITEFEGAAVTKSKTFESMEAEPVSEIKCVPDTRGGGCLIATATYGSELAPQVQQLREIRDNGLLETESGSAFMEQFNQFYYSFSPTIADLERENPIFKEVVKLAITPLVTSLSILNYVNFDSEETVLGYGISLILLNVGMYFVAPFVLITKVRKLF